MVDIRKIITMREVIFSELGVTAARPVVRAVGMAVIRNPSPDASSMIFGPWFEAGAMLGERLMPELVKLLEGRQSRTARAHSSVSTARWSTAAHASTRC